MAKEDQINAEEEEVIQKLDEIFPVTPESYINDKTKLLVCSKLGVCKKSGPCAHRDPHDSILCHAFADDTPCKSCVEILSK
jgi:hypothetical protein